MLKRSLVRTAMVNMPNTAPEAPRDTVLDADKKRVAMLAPAQKAMIIIRDHVQQLAGKLK